MDANDPRHGTQVGYKDNGCRCDVCRRAMSYAANVYRMRRAANGGRHLMVDKLGSVRRLQALMALGWPRRELARQAGYRGDAFALLLNGQRRLVTIDTAAKITNLYERLSMTHGPSNITQMRATAAGWPPPLAWDDIDDPDEQPTDWQRTEERGGGWCAPERHADLDDLIESGATLADACRTLGITAEALEKWADRHGRRADFNRLVARMRGAA